MLWGKPVHYLHEAVKLNPGNIGPMVLVTSMLMCIQGVNMGLHTTGRVSPEDMGIVCESLFVSVHENVWARNSCIYH